MCSSVFAMSVITWCVCPSKRLHDSRQWHGTVVVLTGEKPSSVTVLFFPRGKLASQNVASNVTA